MGDSPLGTVFGPYEYTASLFPSPMSSIEVGVMVVVFGAEIGTMKTPMRHAKASPPIVNALASRKESDRLRVMRR